MSFHLNGNTNTIQRKQNEMIKWKPRENKNFQKIKGKINISTTTTATRNQRLVTITKNKIIYVIIQSLKTELDFCMKHNGHLKMNEFIIFNVEPKRFVKIRKSCEFGRLNLEAIS